ncbi:hypothetical protein KSF_090610 [Reticulibacter mediterranei]|uniref:HTH cro/C1-type domain-containing protein n=1 Tax=Reticulibacter mediterranei TaxID=2778369 RepID=A0A8J3IUY7_9CHLR|nr:helix-turn-helix domain-containing protein [Reticulibacter mediterranei]GHO99013.1 hypothetical protein KSF_090610 [Reticulibacter mediterranei]
MKHKAGAIPNLSLRRERELRGWSQQELAERIGASSEIHRRGLQIEQKS